MTARYKHPRVFIREFTDANGRFVSIMLAVEFKRHKWQKYRWLQDSCDYSYSAGYGPKVIIRSEPLVPIGDKP